jgi:hypothetical protein
MYIYRNFIIFSSKDMRWKSTADGVALDHLVKEQQQQQPSGAAAET